MEINRRKLSNKLEIAIIVAVDSNNCNLSNQIEELTELSNTAGAKIIDSIIQKRKTIDPKTYVGKGRIQSIIQQADELRCYLIIFNDELTPSQSKNIQKIAGDKIKIIDRTGLIIDIFYQHARTKESKTQVEIARLQYLLPRLTRQWTHLERQMGGIGIRGGPGETQIEIDRRLIRNKISQLNKRLLKIETQRKTQSSLRKKIYKIAIVGYTNAGKSTLMKAITKSNVYIENQLFATLDTTTRKMKLNDSTNCIISDTVGFIRELPHDLIASFKSTLSEVRNADLLIKVLDATSTELDLHNNTIIDVLTQLKAEKKPTITLLNKVDKIKDTNLLTSLAKAHPKSLFVSALNQLNLDKVNQSINSHVIQNQVNSTLIIPYANTAVIDKVYKLCNVVKRKNTYNHIHLDVTGTKENIEIVNKAIKDEKYP